MRENAHWRKRLFFHTKELKCLPSMFLATCLGCRHFHSVGKQWQPNRGEERPVLHLEIPTKPHLHPFCRYITSMCWALCTYWNAGLFPLGCWHVSVSLAHTPQWYIYKWGRCFHEHSLWSETYIQHVNMMWAKMSSPLPLLGWLLLLVLFCDDGIPIPGEPHTPASPSNTWHHSLLHWSQLNWWGNQENLSFLPYSGLILRGLFTFCYS